MNYFPNLIHGVLITLILMLCSIICGLVLAILMVVIQYSSLHPLKKIFSALQFFIRGTPLLVQIFLIYYGLSQFEWIRNSYFWLFLKSPMSCAILALSLNTACYTAVLLSGAIQSVPKNEVDACKALGMSKWLALRRIILPRAFQIALPAYSNEIVIVLKCTTLASTITLLDVMGVVQQTISKTYATLEWYLIAGIIYLVLTAAILSMFKFITKTKLAKFN